MLSLTIFGICKPRSSGRGWWSGGRNQSDQVFYTSCDAADIHSPSAWSVPLPILSGASQIAQYIDRRDGGLTLFANVGADRLMRGTQDPATSRWTFSGIALPAANFDAKPTRARSYTTSVHVTDANGMPVPGAPCTLTPDGRTEVYINNVYYALDGGPVIVNTDASGALVIIEWISGLSGTQISASAGANSAVVRPGNIPMAHMKGLDTVAALDSAKIRRRDGSTEPLLPEGTSDDAKAALAGAIQKLNTAHTALTNRTATPEMHRAAASAASYVAVLWGDLVESLDHIGEYTLDLIRDATGDVWHFVVTVAGKAYGFVIDGVEKVAAALKAVWEKLVTGFDRLWDFLRFLFDVDDVLLTTEVFAQVVRIYLHKAGEELQDRTPCHRQRHSGRRQCLAHMGGRATAKPRVAPRNTGRHRKGPEDGRWHQIGSGAVSEESLSEQRGECIDLDVGHAVQR